MKKNLRCCLLIVLCFVMAFAVSCKDDPKPAPAPAHEHKWDEGKVTKEATCTEAGEKTYTCTECEETKTEPIEATGHTYNTKWSSDETNHWHSASCGHDLKEGTAAHDWDNGVITSESCTEERTKTYTCNVCGRVREETVPAGKHNLVTVEAKEPTCTDVGWDEYKKCSNCVYKEGYSEKPATGHTYYEAWTKDDYEHWHAAKCGHNVKSESAAHDIKSEVKTEPTATTDGLERKYCTVCGWEKLSVIPSSEYEKYTYKKDATQHWKDENAKEAHTLEWVDKEKTSEDEPVRAQVCTVCGYEAKIEITHPYGDKWSYNDENHYKESTCSHKVKKDQAAHTWSESVVEATCTKPGTKTKTCTVCGKVVTEPITIKEHSYETIAAKEPTCTEKGWDAYQKCSVCGVTKGYSEKPAKGHTYDEAKWSSDETNHWHSASCGDDLKKDTAEHTWDSGTPTLSCSETGEVTYSCTVCGYSKKVMESGKHVFNTENICTSCGGYKCGENVVAIYDATAKTLTVKGTGAMAKFTEGDNVVTHFKDNEIETLTIEAGVTSVGEYAFYKGKIKNLVIGKDVEKIYYWGFSETTLENITFAEDGKLSVIDGYVFRNNKSLKSVVLPSSLRTMSSGVFYGCSSLESVTINEGFTKFIGGDVFSESAVKTIKLPASFEKATKRFWNNRVLTTITVAEENKNVKAVDGILYSADGKSLIGVPAGKTEVTILDTVEIVEKCAFWGWKGASISLPDSVKTVRAEAFRTCYSLKTVNIGSKIESIDTDAFCYCAASYDLKITIAKPENSIAGYEKCWKEHGSASDKTISIVWTGTSET